MTSRSPLCAADWAEAALRAIGEGGLAAVAVETLAVRLGATKGSFYWHFPNREALVTAALERWERRATDDVIAALAPVADPLRRLRRLGEVAFSDAPEEVIEATLLSSSGDPLVAPVLARVTAARLGFIERCLRDLGFPPADARRRAVLLYTAHVGFRQVSLTLPDALPKGRQRAAYLRLLLAAVTQTPREGVG